MIVLVFKNLFGISILILWDWKVLEIFFLFIVGSVFSEKVGLLVEEVDVYIKKGYFLNDCVGIFYLEK